MPDTALLHEPTSCEPSPEQIATDALHSSVGMSRADFDRAVELLGRLPNLTEVGIIASMWSEHCSYRSTRHLLRTLPSDGPAVLQGPGENAGVVDIGDGLAIAFKIESHNHPSAVEPYQGAATGVGGILRDVFAMGARPIALLNSLRFGPIDAPHERRNRYLFSQVVAGIAGYGNCMGVPTVGGEAVFDERYRHNPLVNAMCVGLVEHERLQLGVASGVGNEVWYVGARTGRDGIHGATFSSVSDPTTADRAAVQVGDPFLEKLLMEATLELAAADAAVAIQDMGAAGLTSSSVEMAARAGTGMHIDLDRVPAREPGMTPYEFMLSESQERMLVVLEPDARDTALAIFDRYGLEAARIGTVTADPLLQLEFAGTIVASLPIGMLVDDAPRSTWPARRKPAADPRPASGHPPAPAAARVLLELLARPTIASKAWIYRQYDHTVRARTVIGPGSDAAVVSLPGTTKLLAVTTDGNGRHVALDPHAGTAAAVAEAARNLVCTGARPLALTNCLNFSSPEVPHVAWQLEQAVAGLGHAASALATPVVSGNVSLYNQTGGIDIHPTPVVGMIGLVDDPAHLTAMAWQHTGSALVLVGPRDGAALAGSEFESLWRAPADDFVPVDLDVERAVQHAVRTLIVDGVALSAHDASDGGLAVALAESAIAASMGAHIDLPTELREDQALFGEGPSRVVVEVPYGQVAYAAAVCDRAGADFTLIGRTHDGPLRLHVNGAFECEVAIERCAQAWKGALPSLMD